MFFAVDPSDWRLAREKMLGAFVWPRELAIVDLRYLQDQALRPRGRFPTRRQLASAWKWSTSKVSRLLVDVDAWSDPGKRDLWDAWYESNRRGSKVNQKRTKSGPKADQERIRRGPSKVDNLEIADQKRIKSEPKADQERIKDEHTRVLVTTTTTTTTTATNKNADLDRVWEHYRLAYRRIHGSSLNRRPPKRCGLATVIREHGEARARDLIDWYETSDDDRASFLREKRIGHSTLFRPAKAAAYLEEWVAPWREAQAQPFTNPAKPKATPRFARRFRVLSGTDGDVLEGE